MIRRPWRTSFSLSLAINLSLIIILVWLLSTSAILFVNFQQSQHALQQQIVARINENINELSTELLDIERDVSTLHHTWQNLSNTDQGPEHYLAARYIPDNEGIVDNQPLIHRTLAFVEAYGSGGMGNIINTFVVLDKGVVISSASNSPTNNFCHVTLLRELRKNLNANVKSYNGIIWSKPYYSREQLWNMFVVKRDEASGVLIGLTIEITSSLGFEISNDYEKIVWLAKDGDLIFANTNKKTPSRRCFDQYGAELDGDFVVCREVLPMGFQLQFFTPSVRIRDSSLTVVLHYLPIALLILVILVSLLYLELQRKLGRRLNTIVSSLDPNVPISLLSPLVVEGEDELGRVAQVYNSILEAVQIQYAVLEAKVAERTTELELARHQAERANANKSEHLNNVSHEIRTPLNGIIGALTLLSQNNMSNEQQELMDTGIKCSRHLLDIINNLLDFSCIESGQMKVIFESLDPIPLIDQAMLTVQLLAQEKGLRLHCQLDSTFPPSLNTDGLRLKQILINLLGNAVKFTDVGDVQLRGWSEGGTVYFRVTDSGPGIQPAYHDDVFNPFQQVDSHQMGSGLGLSISRSLAHLLGGELFLETVPVGASFQLKLPLETELFTQVDRGPILAPACLHEQLVAWGYQPQLGDNPQLDAQELCYLPERLRQCLEGHPVYIQIDEHIPISPWSLQVLLVDDVETNREIVGHMLREQGHQVYLAESGTDALLLGGERVFDLVLMDLRMPGLSGEETLHLWRDEGNSMLDPHCPIIALTANAQPGERQRLLHTGFNEYLTKPVTPVGLSQALDYASNLQLLRGIEPAFNHGGAVLGASPQLLPQLAEELSLYMDHLEQSLEIEDYQKVFYNLHTIKGLAGQGGLKLVHEACCYWEDNLKEGAVVPAHILSELRRLVRLELNVC